MKYTLPHLLLTYNQVSNLIDLEEPIRKYIKEKYTQIRFNDRKLFSETIINELIRLNKKYKDDNLNELLTKYLNYIEQLDIQQKSDKYNI